MVDRVDVWDGWRGFAILLVLIGHFFDTFWIWEERMGVDVFFALSGTLMAMILFEKRMSLRDFYVRRFSRVYPAFFIYIVGVFSLAVLMGQKVTVLEFISTATFMSTYLPSEYFVWSTDVIIGHLWSLNVEEHAYVFMSLFSILFVGRFANATVVLMIAFFLMFVSLYSLNQDPENYKFYQITTQSSLSFIFFSAGYGIFKRARSITLPQQLPGFLLIPTGLCYLELLPVWLHTILAPVLLGVIVNHLAESAAWLKRIFLSWPMQRLGLYSFSIYLWQQIFYKFSYKLPMPEITGIVLSIAIAVASFYIVEKPVRTFVNNRWSKVPAFRGEARLLS